MLNDPAEMCLCCHADDACEFDPHLGDVCEECGEDLEIIGWWLVEHPALDLCHPPVLGSFEAEIWPYLDH